MLEKVYRASSDPTFTGEESHWESPEIVRVITPALLRIKKVSRYIDGKMTRSFYEWEVVAFALVLARCDYAKLPRTRKAAIAQAKSAMRRFHSSLTG
jgi:hypothetical protein